MTVDLAVCYARDLANLRRLAAALAPYHPHFGDLDILPEVTGIGGDAQVFAGASELVVGDAPVPVMDLDGLEPSERAIAEIRRRPRE